MTAGNLRPIMNGFRALLVLGAVAISIVTSITLITLTNHSVPEALTNSLIALVTGAAGGGIVHLFNGRKPP